MATGAKFKLKIMNPDRMLYEGDIGALFVAGDTGEFEVLAYHYPVLSLLKEGELVIDWENYIPIKSGIIKFFRNDCVVMIELAE